MKVKFTAAFWLFTCCAWLMLPAASHAQVVLASWQNNSGDGCIDWPANVACGYCGVSITSTTATNQYSDNLPIYPNVYSFQTGVVPGYAQSLEINEAGGWNQNLALNLTMAQFQALTNNSLLSFTFSCPPGTNGGNVQIPQIVINSPGSWYTYTLSTNNCTVTGATNWDYDSWNTAGMPNFDYWNGSPARSQTVTLNYANLLPTLIANGWSYCQIIFSSYNGGGAPTYWYMNDVTLSSPLCTIDYTVDDFSTNGVGPTNPTNDDYFATAYSYAAGDIGSVWGPWFGGGCSGVSFAPSVSDPYLNVPGHGAMAVNLTWGGVNDQWLVYHLSCGTIFTLVPGGTTGIGYPAYTSLSCDVMFDPSSVTNANGVYGDIRLGIVPGTTCNQDWIGDSYTTITDTNWHHISGTLPNNNSDFTDIGSVLIGEDASYLGGAYLNGNQTLYVANIKFTGPCVAPVIPPPTLTGPHKTYPGLRIFCASSANTYDRAELFTVDCSQSWVDPLASYPVKYSYSLQDYNPNITQVHIELIPGCTPTSEYVDWGAANMLWMVLNPGPAAGQVVCNVQWKTNAVSSNPGGTGNPYGNALSFTNSTAVGTWSLVFTGPTTGYVSGPGQVILGPTNFTIADGAATNDFADPMYATFGLQPNSTAGEGAYMDYGTIQVSGVAGTNEFEDFTKEGSDIVNNLTPSGLFNNSASAAPAGLIIQTTNDVWWIDWTQPAVGFTLASSTNLMSTNWINPGYYSGYSDTNAPRVMPYTAPFVNEFWVLLPKDDVPPGPTAFFLVSTNVVSP